jgi:hypothetical protein
LKRWSVYSALSLLWGEPTWLGSAAMRFIHVPISAGSIAASNFFSISTRFGGAAVCESTGAAMSEAARTVAARIVLRMIRPHGFVGVS